MILNENNEIISFFKRYDEAFPALPPNPSGPNSGPTSGLSSPGGPSKWSQKMRIGSNIVTSVFNIPFEERNDRNRFGESDALKTCADITKQTEAHIEMSSSARDQSLTFLITGKQVRILKSGLELWESLVLKEIQLMNYFVKFSDQRFER